MRFCGDWSGVFGDSDETFANFTGDTAAFARVMTGIGFSASQKFSQNC
jgi:hypothetical protein